MRHSVEKLSSAKRRLSLRLPSGVAVVFLVLFSAPSVKGQVCAIPGKDGPGGTLSGIVNTYYPGTGSVSAGATSIPIGTSTGSATPIAIGDLLLVIQMQDAAIDSSDSNSYGDGNGGNPASGSTLLNNSGAFEYVVATSAAGASVSIRGTNANGLINAYTNAAASGTQGQRRFQVVRVPQYSSATLGSGLTASPWNGSTGGILAIDVAGALTLGSATVSLDGMGFRGGGTRQLNGGSGGANSDFVNLSTVPFHGGKGEGIAGTPRYVYDAIFDTVTDTGVEGYPNGSTARGAPGNAGGGGTDGDAVNQQNSGGGGGGNAGAGGRGGNTWQSNLTRGGHGGTAFTGAANRMVLGGGGGGGSRNNSSGTASSGGAGGGIVMIRAGTISGSATISANGSNGNDADNDGGGGAGAGGSVMVVANSGGLGSLVINARGGQGGDAWPGQAPNGTPGERHGPGGGGGGGFIATSAAATTSVAAGNNGVTTTASDAYSALPGSAGSVITITVAQVPGASSGAQCVPILTTTKTTSTPAVINTPTGVTATYTIVVSNAANRGAATNLAISDTLPANFTYSSTTSVTLGGTATRSPVVNPTVGDAVPNWGTFNIPGGSSVTIVFVAQIASTVVSGTYQNPATATYTDPTRTVSGGTTTSSYASGSSTAEDVAVTVRDMTMTKSHAGNFTVGINGTYTLTAHNSGTAASSGTITVVDNLPAGLTVAAIPAPANWNCSTTVVGSSTMTCTSSTVVAAGANHPNTISLSVVVAPAAFPSVTNSATISGGGEINAGNNSASDPTTVNGVSDVRIAKSHSGNFTVGVNGTYTLTASNAGTLATSGNITVVDNLPAGLTVAAIPAPANWNCSTTVVGSSTMTCTSSTVVAAGANHPNTISLSVVVAPAAFPSVTNSATISGGGEPAYNNGNNTVTDPTTVDGISDVRIAKSHSGNFTVGINGTYTLTASNSGTLATSGTITVVDNLPTGLTVAAIPAPANWNCSTTVVGSSTMTCTSSTVVAAGANHPNTISLSVVVSAAAFAASPVTNVATISGGGEPAYNNGNNSASDPTTIIGAPDMTITKTHVGNFTVGVNGSYTLTARNSGTAASSGTITVVDNLPTGLTVAAIPAPANWNCSTTVVGSSTVTCTSSTVVAAGANHPNTISLSVVVAPAAFPSVTNSATISGGGENNVSNNSASDPTTVNGVSDVRIAKSHSGNFTVGVNGIYTLTASNAGTLATSGTITVVDNLPTGLTVAAIPAPANWNCSTTVVGSSTMTCTSSTVVAAGANHPNTISLSVVVSAAAFAASPVTNVATISGGGEPAYNNGNNSVSDPTIVDGVSDVRIAKSHSGNFTVGVNGTYTLTASNSGTLATSGTITVIDNLPTGLTVAAIPAPANWDCSTTVVGSSTMTCTSSTVVAAGANHPNTISLSVVVAPAAFPSVTNSATISGGGEPAYNNGNNTVTDPTTVNGVSDVRIAKSHSGNFTVGVNGTYTLTASNAGTLATSGTITVVDNLPAGLTVAAIPAPANWNCSTTVVGSSTMTCTSSTVVAAGANHPNTISLSVVVAPAAFPSVTNSATIAGGGEPAYNNGNNTVTDPTTVDGVADVRIAKSHSGNFTVGVNGTYTLTASNAGTLATSGTITVVDNLPTGLTVAAIPAPANWNCSTTVVGSSTMTCTSSTVVAAGANHPNTISLSVAVSAAAFAASPVTNVATISGGGEPAYNNGNNSASDPTTINGAPDMTISKSHSGNFTVGVNGTYTLTASNSGTAASSGTITVVDNLPTGLTVAAIPAPANWNCSTTVVGSSTMTCTSSTVVAAGANHPNTISLSVVVAPAAFPSVTNSATISGGGENNVGNNSASDPTTVNGVSDVRIAKSHSGNFTVGVNGTYTLTASNAGTLATSGTITVVDNLPTGLTVAAIPAPANWNCSTTVVGSSTMTCTSSTVVAAGASHPNTISLSVVVAPAASPAVTNVVNISGGGEPAYNNGNNTVTDPTTVDGVSDVRIAKSHSGNFTVGVNGTYTLTASNAGTLATSGTITVVDNLPTGLTVAAIPVPANWNCSTTVVGSSTMTCTSSTVVAAGANHPNSISLSVVVAPAAFPSVTNSATISGGGEPAYNNGNNSASDPTTVNGAADLIIAKTHVGNFTVGVNGTYTLTASNAGTLATSGTITVVDNLPTGLTVAAIPAPANWNCSTTVVGSSTMTCTSSTVVAAGANHPNTISLSVVVAPAAFPSVTNSATISGGGEPAYNNGNNTVTDPTTVDGVADVRIAKSHSGNFTVGVNGTYTLTASNAGTLATSGTITVVDNLPAGLTVAAIPAPANWDCSTTVVGSSTMTCTSTTVVAAGANHPNTISLSVVVAPAAFPSVTNSATISGGGEPAYNNGNNTASDPTTVNGAADLTITKSHSGNFTQLQVGATYTITVTNSGSAATSGVVTVTDTLPVGLSATGISGPGWNCLLGTLTCTRNDSLNAGLSYAPITLTVDVALTAPPSVTNSVTVSGGGESNTANNTANDPTTIDAAAPPNIFLVKSVNPGGSQAPGTDLNYTIVYANNGGQPATNFTLVDPNAQNVDPLERVFHNVDFKVGSITSTPGSTGLVATFEYSNDGGATWTYTPVSGGGSAPAGYDRNVTNVRWVFAGSLSHLAPNNSGSVDFIVRIR